MNFRSFPRAMDEIFFCVIPHDIGNIWIKFQLSRNFSLVLMDFGLIQPVYKVNCKITTPTRFNLLTLLKLSTSLLRLLLNAS